MSFVVHQTNGQDIYRTDANWSDKSSQKKELRGESKKVGLVL